MTSKKAKKNLGRLWRAPSAGAGLRKAFGPGLASATISYYLYATSGTRVRTGSRATHVLYVHPTKEI
jgi:hypothetical protein